MLDMQLKVREDQKKNVKWSVWLKIVNAKQAL